MTTHVEKESLCFLEQKSIHSPEKTEVIAPRMTMELASPQWSQALQNIEFLPDQKKKEQPDSPVVLQKRSTPKKSSEPAFGSVLERVARLFQSVLQQDSSEDSLESSMQKMLVSSFENERSSVYELVSAGPTSEVETFCIHEKERGGTIIPEQKEHSSLSEDERILYYPMPSLNFQESIQRSALLPLEYEDTLSDSKTIDIRQEDCDWMEKFEMYSMDKSSQF